MKYLLFIAFSIISCKTNTVKPPLTDDNSEIMAQQSKFKKSFSENSTYILYYKVEENMQSPMKIFTYYVTDSKTNEMVRKSEDVAAERIYWKDNNTIAIIPYTEMIQKNDVVGEVPKTNEILIKIN